MGGLVGIAWHFCQKADGVLVLGVVTISIGFFKCCMIDSSRLQSFGVSGINVISQEYDMNQAFESCFVRTSICV